MPAPCSCLSMGSPALTTWLSTALCSGILSWAKALWEEDKLTHCSPSALTTAGHWLRLCVAPVPAVFKACECLWYALAAGSPVLSQSPRHSSTASTKALNFITFLKQLDRAAQSHPAGSIGITHFQLIQEWFSGIKSWIGEQKVVRGAE